MKPLLTMTVLAIVLGAWGCSTAGSSRTDNPAANAEKIVAEVRARNPDRSALCKSGFNGIRHEVTVVATEMVMNNRLSMADDVQNDGARATQQIYSGCIR